MISTLFCWYSSVASFWISSSRLRTSLIRSNRTEKQIWLRIFFEQTKLNHIIWNKILCQRAAAVTWTQTLKAGQGAEEWTDIPHYFTIRGMPSYALDPEKHARPYSQQLVLSLSLSLSLSSLSFLFQEDSLILFNYPLNLCSESRFSIPIRFNLTCDQDLPGWTRMLVARFTWKHSQALDYLTASGLHGNPVIAHQERKHDQGHKLAGVGLQSTKSEKQEWRCYWC